MTINWEHVLHDASSGSKLLGTYQLINHQFSFSSQMIIVGETSINPSSGFIEISLGLYPTLSYQTGPSYNYDKLIIRYVSP